MTEKSPGHYRKQILSSLKIMGRTHDTYRVFSDWVEMMALAIANAVDKSQFDKREARYMQIVKAYSKEEAQQMADMFGMFVMLLEVEPEDQFTKLFGELELGNKHMSQFFTPWSISYLMAKMTMGGETTQKIIDQDGFITMCEPCCGAGGLVIASAMALKDEEINFQKYLHVRAVDIDARCVHMTYIQCSLLHIPAIIYRGNTLGMTFSETWYTPAHIMGGWTWRLRAREIDERDNGWWRAYSMQQRISFLQQHGLDVEEAIEPLPSASARAFHQIVETAP